MQKEQEPTLLDIRLLGDPVLREKAVEIDSISNDHIDLARSMFETMYEAPGVGLAAPQVGVSLRLICVDAGGRGRRSEGVVVVNPEIIDAEGEDVGEEGCLSIPGFTGDVTRAEKIVLRGQNLEGRSFEVEYKGYAARIFQHEIDHLDGILFIDYLPRLRRNMIKKSFRKKLAREEV